MAIVPRRRKSGTVFYVAFTWAGKRVWERSGYDKREAQRLDARRGREVKAGTFIPPANRRATTVYQYAIAWGAHRKVRTAANEVALLDRHVLARKWFADLPIAEVRPRHYIQLIEEMGRERADDEARPPLSGKSVAIVAGILRTLFRDAQIAEVTQGNPCVAPRGLLKRRGKKRAPYTAAEARALMGPLVTAHRRIWNALAFYAGMREGEICGLRWSDYQNGLGLRALIVERQYEGAPLKTDNPRVVPVHPDLEGRLVSWRNLFEMLYGSPPELDDPIVPNQDRGHHIKTSAYKAWRKSCDEAGVVNHSLHSTRHTFISQARRGGARKDVLERVTHNAQGDIVDQYTTFDWAPLCEAVLCLRYTDGVDGNVDAVSRLPVIAAPAPGLEVGIRSDSSGQLAKVPAQLPPARGQDFPQIRKAEAKGDAGLTSRLAVTDGHRGALETRLLCLGALETRLLCLGALETRLLCLAFAADRVGVLR